MSLCAFLLDEWLEEEHRVSCFLSWKAYRNATNQTSVKFVSLEVWLQHTIEQAISFVVRCVINLQLLIVPKGCRLPIFHEDKEGWKTPWTDHLVCSHCRSRRLPPSGISQLQLLPGYPCFPISKLIRSAKSIDTWLYKHVCFNLGKIARPMLRVHLQRTSLWLVQNANRQKMKMRRKTFWAEDAPLR